jgi:predicted deacylase
VGKRRRGFFIGPAIETSVSLTLPDPAPGTVARDTIEVVERLPTGEPETLPCIVVNGTEDGPTLWVTGSIHGNEVTGLAVCQDIVHDELAEGLAGRLVSIPTLNPAGLRRNHRRSYYDDDDPNRKFPDVEYVTQDASPGNTVEGPRPPGQQEIVCRRLFDCFSGDADALLDMHTASAGAHPFVIRDRVLYGRGLRDEREARELAADLEAFSEAFGLPVVFEYGVEEYLGQSLQCSTSGSALNQAGIPAVTVELGQHGVVEEQWRQQGVAGTYRVMDHLGMVDDPGTVAPDNIEGFPDPIDPPLSGQTRRYVGPHAPSTSGGIVRHEVAAGDTVEAGDVVARVVPPNGDPEQEVELTIDHDGWVTHRYPGVAGYENAPVASFAVADDQDVVGTPEDNR